MCVNVCARARVCVCVCVYIVCVCMLSSGCSPRWNMKQAVKSGKEEIISRSLQMQDRSQGSLALGAEINCHREQKTLRVQIT
jgi:hypothetical protein